MPNKKLSVEERFEKKYGDESLLWWQKDFKDKFLENNPGKFTIDQNFKELVTAGEIFDFIETLIKSERQQAVKEQQELIEFLQKERNELVDKLKVAKKQAVKEVLEEISVKLPACGINEQANEIIKLMENIINQLKEKYGQ